MLRFYCSKAKASIIRCPVPVRIAQNGLEQRGNFIEKAAAFLTRQRGRERIGECVQPPPHSSRQPSGARNQLYTLRHKSSPPQPHFIVFDCREVPRNPRSGIFHASALQRSQQRDGNRAHARMAAHLTDESSPDPEGSEGTRNRRVRILLGPVQRRIGKDSTELVF